MALLSSLTELSKLGHQNETKEERALRLASLVVLVQQMEDNTPCGGEHCRFGLRKCCIHAAQQCIVPLRCLDYVQKTKKDWNRRCTVNSDGLANLVPTLIQRDLQPTADPHVQEGSERNLDLAKQLHERRKVVSKHGQNAV
eukprot:1159235-Pelagomonas_calceolata.AAC.20